MPNEDVELVAKLKLDTTDAQNQLQQVTNQANKAGDAVGGVALPKDLQEGIQGMFKGPKGLQNIARVAKSATGGFRALGGALQGVSTVLGKGGGIIALIIAIVSLVVKLMQGTDTIEKVKDSVSGLVDMLKETLAPTLALIGESLLDINNILKVVLEPVLKLVDSVLVYASTLIVGVLKLLTPVFELIGAILDVVVEFASTFSELYNGILTPIFQLLTTFVKFALTPIIGVLNKVSEWLRKLKEQLFEFIEKATFGLVSVGNKTLATTSGKEEDNKTKTSLDTWETSGEETAAERQARLAAESAEDAANAARDGLSAFASLKLALDDTKKKIQFMIESVGKWIAQKATAVWDGIKNLAATVWGWIKDTAKNVWSAVKDAAISAWSWVVDLATTVWSAIKDTALSIWNAISEVATSIWNVIRDAAISVWRFISELATSIWNAIKELAVGIWTAVKDAATDIWSAVKDKASSIWSSVKEKASGIWSKVEDKATGIWSNIEDAGTRMWRGIADFFKKVFGWIGDGVDAIVDSVSDIATGVWDTVSDAASAVWEGAKSVASSAWEGVKSAGNAIGDFFGSIFGHAQGGTLDVGAQIWGMNEQGNPEFMFNAGGRDTVVNASILEDAVAAGVMKANASSKDGGKITVSVDKSAPAGQRELAQWLLPSLKFLLNRG